MASSRNENIWLRQVLGRTVRRPISFQWFGSVCSERWRRGVRPCVSVFFCCGRESTPATSSWPYRLPVVQGEWLSVLAFNPHRLPPVAPPCCSSAAGPPVAGRCSRTCRPFHLCCVDFFGDDCHSYQLMDSQWATLGSLRIPPHTLAIRSTKTKQQEETRPQDVPLEFIEPRVGDITYVVTRCGREFPSATTQEKWTADDHQGQLCPGFFCSLSSFILSLSLSLSPWVGAFLNSRTRLIRPCLGAADGGPHALGRHPHWRNHGTFLFAGRWH